MQANIGSRIRIACFVSYSGGSDGPWERLKVLRLVDLGRRVVALEGALEGRSANRGASCGLLGRAARVVHQVVVLFERLLAAPDPPGHESQTAQNDGTADANHDADDGVASLCRHARGRGVLPGESGGSSARMLAREGRLLSVRSGRGDDRDDGRQNIRSRRVRRLGGRFGRRGG